MKKLLFISLALLLGVLMTSAAWYFSKMNGKRIVTVEDGLAKRLHTRAQQIAPFAAANNYNTNICFLMDMRIEPGKNRFFVYDLQKDSVLDAGLVTHGRCNGQRYSNGVGSHCTSLGKYKIGKPYHGQFGLAYKLYGLDSTNSNAFKRYVVLHSHECVPNAEVHPFPICTSEGCPTVSPAFLTRLAGIIDKSPKPVVLYIYDNN